MSSYPDGPSKLAGRPVDRANALDMVRDQVAGLGGRLAVWGGVGDDLAAYECPPGPIETVLP